MRVRVEDVRSQWWRMIKASGESRIRMDRVMLFVGMLAFVSLLSGCSGIVSAQKTSLPPTFTVSGTISGAGSTGATVTLTGAATATAIADSSGVYTFTGLSNGIYTITPSRAGYTFSPGSQSVAISGANVSGMNFTSAPSVTSYSISGTISGAGGNGATVTLSGAAAATTTANSSGNYNFTGLTNGVYTVTPASSGFTFTPSSQNVTINGANVTGANFTATTATTSYAITGTISGAGGGGATVVLSGAASAGTTANGSGSYSFAGLANGTYTVTPSKTGYTFSPASQNVTINGANATVATFTATAVTYSISGTISGAGGNGATATLSGAAAATTTANSSGNYNFTGLAPGTYAVTPSNSGYTFMPSSQAVTLSSANVTNLNFTATVAQPTYSISGTISPVAGGNGALVTMTGTASGTTIADSSGNYAFTGLANGTYTVVPSSAGYSYGPPSQSVTVNGANVSGINFSATVSSTVIFYDNFQTDAAVNACTAANTPTGCKWFVFNAYSGTNNEQQCYRPSQVSVGNSGLTETATVQTCSSGQPYTSVAIAWAPPLTFTYGTVEYVAKMAGGTGPWPAIWMIGADCQPSSPSEYLGNCNWPSPNGADEIDITEILGSNLTSVNQQIHTGSHNDGCSASTTDVSQNFHDYKLVWSAGSLVWYIDGNATCTIEQSYVPSDQMYLIMNLAVGGNGGGNVDNSTLPQSTTVRWVKVTQP